MGGCCSAAELAVTEEQRQSVAQMGAQPQSLSDDAFLSRIEAESAQIGYGAEEKRVMGPPVQMNEKQQRRMKKMVSASEDVLGRSMAQLLEENRRLKGEVLQWKAVHQNLYNFTCN